MQARLEGTLTVDSTGCVRARTSGGDVAVVWPRGYHVRGDAASFEILDSAKHVVARSRAAFVMGGGGAEFQDSWTSHDCYSGGALWLVGDMEVP